MEESPRKGGSTEGHPHQVAACLNDDRSSTVPPLNRGAVLFRQISAVDGRAVPVVTVNPASAGRTSDAGRKVDSGA